MRMERIIRLHPEVVANIQADTSIVTSYDTLFVQLPGTDKTIVLTDTVIVHDSLGTITIYKQKEGKIRVVTQYKPFFFPIAKSNMVINRQRTLLQAEHPIDKWKYRKQGIYGSITSILIFIIIFFIIKNYYKL